MVWTSPRKFTRVTSSTLTLRSIPFWRVGRFLWSDFLILSLFAPAVIVGKTLQQALMEVMEEEELENMRAHQREFQQLRDAELAETQRLEEAERRRHEEKERRLQQERVRLEMEKEAREKVAARAYAQHCLSDLMGSVFGSLRETGFFYDTVERDVETGESGG